jgi:hypothetical protein
MKERPTNFPVEFAKITEEKRFKRLFRRNRSERTTMSSPVIEFFCR